MLREILCFVAVLLVTQCSAKPQFCRKYDCPEYTVESKTDDYEVRCYRSYRWVTTTVSGTFFTTSKAFMRLFRYIDGANDREIKINMTVPVTMEKSHETFSKKPQNMSFFIPYDHQENPPRPTDSDVYLRTTPRFCVYVRTFAWWMSMGEWWHYWRLQQALKKDGLADRYIKDYYITAAYNSPMELRPWKRHNEIWFVRR